VIFTLGSIGCSLVGTLPQLVVARIVQGMGGAMMVPVGRLVVLRMIPKSELVSAMAYLTVPALIGPVIGPPLGGFIVTYASWRWIFLINIPIGVLGFALATAFIGNLREPREEPLDVKGFAIVSLGLAATMFGFENLGRGVLSPVILSALIAGGGSLLALYVWHARSLGAPILDLALLRVQTFRASVAGAFAFRMGVGALPFLVPLMLQIGFGLTPFASGMITFASAAGALAMKLAAAPILRLLGFRRVLLVNTILCSIFMASYGFFGPTTPHLVMIATLLVGGFFRSLQLTSLNTLAYAEISEPSMSRATTLASVGQQLSLTFGVGLGALLLHGTLLWTGKTALGSHDFGPAFFAIAAISLVSLFFFLPLPRNAGSEISGREEGREAVADATHASG
jgi:MFS family permease